MANMLVKMTISTVLYLIITAVVWNVWSRSERRIWHKIAVGIVFGTCSIMSTHMGIDFKNMILNVRDIGPLAAGLFFDPVSGIISGVLGGAERYIAGTYFDVGSFTTLSCSLSTMLAGFLAAALNVFLYKGRRAPAYHSAVIGMVMEVFHMYVIFLTHREDMDMAFYVVRACSVPMILFSGLGLMFCSVVIKKSMGELHRPFATIPAEDIPVSHKFQTWLFGVTVFVLLVSFGLSYGMHTAAALQKGRSDLFMDSSDISSSVSWIRERGMNPGNYYHSVGLYGSFAVFDGDGKEISGTMLDDTYADTIRGFIKTYNPDEYFNEKIYDVPSLCLLSTTEDGLTVFVEMPKHEIFKSRDSQAYETMLADILFFTIIYVLIAILVQRMVVDNLLRVKNSLNRITDGDLNEKVNVYTSSEFASLSDDINLTVDVLKGYIDAAEKRMEQELLLAHNIQDAALPKNFTFNHRGFEIFASMDPAKEVGGDFYDFFFVEADKMALVIADVSDKGVPAALFMMRSKTAIRGLAESGYEPEEIFFRVNNSLCEGNELNMFVTVWMGIIDLKTGDMRCINAGHEYPVLRRKDGEFEILKDKHRLPLGAMENMTYDSYSLHLDPGDCLYVHTDGIPDAINVEEEQYGLERMVNALNMNKDTSMEGLLLTVKADQDEFVGEANQFDDITMMGFRYDGPQEVGA